MARSSISRRRSKSAGFPWTKVIVIFVIVLFSGLVVTGGVIGAIVWIKHRKTDKNEKTEVLVDAPVTDPGDPPVPRDPMTTVVPNYRGQDPLNASQQFRMLLNELDTKEPGWRLAEVERARPEVPPNRNGAIYVLHAFELMGTHHFNNDGKLKILAAHETMTSHDKKYLMDELTKCSSAVGQLRKLAKFPEGRFRVVWTSDPIDTKLTHLGAIARVAPVLYYDTLRLAEFGKADQCIDNVKALIHLARYVREEPTALAQMVRVAVLNYALGALENTLALKVSVSDDTLLSVQQLLEEDAKWPDRYNIFRGERAGFHCAFTNRANGDCPQNNVILTDNDHRVWLSLMTRLVNWSHQPPTQPDPVFNQIESDMRSAPEAVRKVFIASSKMHVAEAKIHTRLSAAVAALRVERYRLKNSAWPSDLGPNPPVDSWAGLPLKWAERQEGIAIYSAFNAPDSGGDFNMINGTSEKTNIGFRLLDPEKRH
jgi:hypothetical protein